MFGVETMESLKFFMTRFSDQSHCAGSSLGTMLASFIFQKRHLVEPLEFVISDPYCAVPCATLVEWQIPDSIQRFCLFSWFRSEFNLIR